MLARHAVKLLLSRSSPSVFRAAGGLSSALQRKGGAPMAASFASSEYSAYFPSRDNQFKGQAAVDGIGEGGEASALRRVAVLVTGYASDYAMEKYGGYGQMFLDLLRDPGEEWEMFHVVDGQFPSESEMERFDAFVVTGSRYDAHADDPWILQLCDMLRDVHARSKRVLGVCFGHQVVGRALGGKTGRAPPGIGWDCGLKELHLTDAFFSKPYAQGLQQRSLRILEFHRDQVSEVPPGGQLLGSSARTGIEMFCVGDNVLCVQGHPEFTTDVVEDLAHVCVKRGTLSAREAEETLQSVKDGGPDRGELQKLLKQFLKRPITRDI